MEDILKQNYSDQTDERLPYKTYANLKKNKLIMHSHDSEKFLQFLLSMCILYAYVSASDVIINATFYKKRRDIIFKSNFLLNKFLQNLSYLYNEPYEQINVENLFLNILGYIEISGMAITQIFSFNNKKDKLMHWKLNIDTSMLKTELLGVYTNPIQTHPNLNYTYYVGIGFINFVSYIRPNISGFKQLKIFNLSSLTKLCLQRYYIQLTLLTYALKILTDMFNLKINSSLELLDALNLKYSNAWNNNSQTDPNYSSILQIHSLYIFFENYKIFEKGFFYTYYYDFRGRLYSDSKLNYSNNRWVRCLLDFGEFTEQEICNFTLALRDQIVWNNSLTNLFQTSNDLHKFFIISIFYELGKIIKSSGVDYNGVLEYQDFIDLGYKLYLDEDNIKYDLKDLDLYEKQIFVFKLNNHTQFYKKKFIFYKDATASGLQMLGLILKPKNDEVAKWLNLQSNKYYFDTYMFIITLFLQKNLIPDEFKKFFTRKTLKKTIMIFNYQGSYYTCYTDFLSYLPKNIPLLTKQELGLIFKKFYKHLEDIFSGTEIFKFKANNIFNLFLLNNNKLEKTLELVYQNNKNIKINSFLENIKTIDKDWYTLITIEGEKRVETLLAENIELIVAINEHLMLLQNKTYAYELDSFMELLKKYSLLKFFKIFFKKDKFVHPINFINYRNSLGHLTKEKQQKFLNHILHTNTLVNPSIFSLMFGDGFLVNYDYVKTVDKKIDIKYRYDLAAHNFYTQLSEKYGYDYNEPKYNYRTTLNITEFAKEIDFERIESSIKANFIHSLDSFIIRQLIAKSNFNCITIHDCIGCDLLHYNKINPLMCEIYSLITFKLVDGSQIKIKNSIQSDFLLI